MTIMSWVLLTCSIQHPGRSGNNAIGDIGSFLEIMTGNIFHGHELDSFFNLVGVLTGQGIQLLGDTARIADTRIRVPYITRATATSCCARERLKSRLLPQSVTGKPLQ